ncbi:unnamed protein product [Microthlaspi erraticum]|uniref:Uncharacterized protein n=1 Tax=Microthlaspi erraticum TaxID=1685480 RepID=A0A6D2IKP9_9BRAS|nr:unnamed protein product [Microthlaspi erraticum]
MEYVGLLRTESPSRPVAPPKPPDRTSTKSLHPPHPPEPPDPPDPPDLRSVPLLFPPGLPPPSKLTAFHISSPQVFSPDLDLELSHLDPIFASGVVVTPLGSPIPAVCSLSSDRASGSSSSSHHLAVSLLLLQKSPDSLDMSSTEVFLLPLVAFFEADSPFVTLIVLLHSLTQVYSSSLSLASPSVDCCKTLVEWLVLVIVPSLLAFVGSLNAVVRLFTAVCRVYILAVTACASYSFSQWQSGKNCLSCFHPVTLVLDFYCPHLSFKELILLPCISLSLSGIVTGSIVKAVLFRAVTKRLFGSRSAIVIVDGLTFLSLEAVTPPLGGFDQDSYCCFVLSANSVEHVRSHLSIYLYLSCCSFFCLILCSTNLWFDALIYLAHCGPLYHLPLEINLS